MLTMNSIVNINIQNFLKKCCFMHSMQASCSTAGIDTSASPSAKAKIPRHENVYNLRVVNNPDIKYKVMSFNGLEKINFTDWQKVQLERTNKVFKTYRRQDQQLFMTVHGKGSHTFKSFRRAIHDDNSSYYILKRTPDDTVEAYPMEEWYHFLMYKLPKRKDGEIPKLSTETETEWEDIEVKVVLRDDVAEKEEDEDGDDDIIEKIKTEEDESTSVADKNGSRNLLASNKTKSRQRKEITRVKKRKQSG